MFVEPRRQLLDVGRTAVLVADRVQLEHVIGDADAAQKLRVELNHLRVDRRVIGADRLDRELPVLAVAPALRPVVPPHRPDRVQLLRLGLALQAVLHVRSADRRRCFRAQRQGSVASVGERVRLLLHDVGAPARRPDDQIRVLEGGCVDAPVPVEGRDVLHLPRHPFPERLLGREDVVGAARRLEARHARSSARNGFRSSSAPIVVSGP